MKGAQFINLTDKDTTQRGDQFNPWGSGFRRLPPPYGWKIKGHPGAKFRRPVLSAQVQRDLKALL